MEVPDGFLVAGVPAQLKRPVEGSPGEMWVKLNPPAYAELAQRHLRGIELVER
jgi:carbonic anhydrase/acetyltransferase-like protein (isoleucine patch superfamily)